MIADNFRASVEHREEDLRVLVGNDHSIESSVFRAVETDSILETSGTRE